MTIREKAVSFFSTLKCICLMSYWSFCIIYQALIHPCTSRKKIGDITHQGSKKLLRILKATYSISYEKALKLEENSCYIFMSNHLSLIDLPLIYATIQHTLRPIAKAELFKVPLLGRAMRLGECIPIQRADAAHVYEYMTYAKDKLKSGVALLIFPEGTRSATNQLAPFKSGPFYLAKETAAKIIPIGLINTNAILAKKKFLLSLGKKISIKVGEPIDSLNKTTNELKDMVHNAINDLIRTDDNLSTPI
jgi:1-acyl-sn-glycerol-3-phosphate acyltransferase